VAYVDWPTPGGVEGRKNPNVGTHLTSPDWLALAKLSVIRQLSRRIGMESGEVRCDIVECALALYFCIYIFLYNHIIILKSDTDPYFSDI